MYCMAKPLAGNYNEPVGNNLKILNLAAVPKSIQMVKNTIPGKQLDHLINSLL